MEQENLLAHRCIRPSLLSQDGLSRGILTTEPVDGDVKGGERALMERRLGDACNGGKASKGRIVTQRIKRKQKKERCL